MTQGYQRSSVWSRGTITLLVAIWIAVAVGNWLAHRDEIQKKIGQGEQEGTVQEVNVPEARKKPWKGDITALQKKLDEDNFEGLKAENTDVQLVVANPASQVVADKSEAASGKSEANDSEAPVKYGLIFATYHRDSQAMELMTRLTTKSVKSHIERSTDSDGSDLYRVFSDQEYDTEEKANKAKSDLLKIGFDSLVINR